MSVEVTGGSETAGVDGLVERIGRWAAARSTRRSFLGRLGRVAVLVAGGPGMVGLLSEPASARVCGQSGVSPKCDTFDCDETWGWCWYASGCCAGGLLKKICDCCAPNTPNPRGYCPSGTEVLCILESCGADPRLQTVALHHLTEQDPIPLTIAVSQQRYPRGAPIVVIGDAESPEMSALAMSAGRVVGGPVLLTKRPGLDVGVGEELERLGAEYATVIGSRLDPRVERHLRERGIEPHRVGTADTLAALSAEIAVWSRDLTGKRTLIVVRPSVATEALAPAAALAHDQMVPLLLGTDDAAFSPAFETPRRATSTIVVTDDPSDAEAFPGGVAVTADDVIGYSLALADVGVDLGGLPDGLAMAAADRPEAALAVATLPAALLLHPAGSLDRIREWLFANREEVVVATVVDRPDAFPSDVRYELQSILNEYETHLLIGSSGEGLPVIPQPIDERPIGKARDTRPESEQG